MNRLSKILARYGIASRRQAERIIEEGRVLVDGEKILLPQYFVDPEQQQIIVDGNPLKKPEEKVVFILNKPVGYLCSNRRFNNQKLVIDLLEQEPYRLFTVGRLDKESSGLLIVTNDGHFSQAVIHPSRNFTKEYLVKVQENITEEHLKAIQKGVVIERKLCIPHRVEKIRRGTCKICVKEGKKHEVRLLCKQAGLSIIELKRIRIGSLTLGKLPIGSYRKMSEKEKALFEIS
ncbi:MAG: rRNA pseudouridine synthase [Parachlamydiales bacterium]|nr:rRNA pseudouridine synthase [Parachlamydiales bacterium]